MKVHHHKPAHKPAHAKPHPAPSYNQANNAALFQMQVQDMQRRQAYLQGLQQMAAIGLQLGALFGQFLGGQQPQPYQPVAQPQSYQPYQPVVQPQSYQPYQPVVQPQPYQRQPYLPAEQPAHQPLASYYSNTTAWGGGGSSSAWGSWGAAAAGYYNS